MNGYASGVSSWRESSDFVATENHLGWVMHGVARCLDTRGLINPGWVAQVRVSDDLRPETPRDPGFITDDVSKLHLLGVSIN